MQPFIQELMQFVIAHSQQLLLAGNATIAAAAGLAVMRFQRLARQSDAFRKRAGGVPLAGQEGVDSALLGFLDHRLRLMQTRIETLATRRPANTVPTLPPQSLDKPGSPFEYAVHMARQGAGVEELVRACGLSRAEARLIHRVHGRPAGGAKAA